MSKFQAEQAAEQRERQIADLKRFIQSHQESLARLRDKPKINQYDSSLIEQQIRQLTIEIGEANSQLQDLMIDSKQQPSSTRRGAKFDGEPGGHLLNREDTFTVKL